MEQDILEAREKYVKEVSLKLEDLKAKVHIGSSIIKQIEKELIKLLKHKNKTFA